MKLSGQFALLNAGIIVLPVLLVAAVFFIGSVAWEPKDSPRRPFAAYERFIEAAPALLKEGRYEELGDRLPRGFEAYLLGEDGRLVASRPKVEASKAEAALMLLKKIAEVSDSAASIHSASFVEIAGGERGLSVVIFPRGVETTLIMSAPLIFLGFLAITSALTSGLVSRSIRRSIRSLEDATRRVAAGDMDFEIEARGSEELVSLTRSFIAMRDELREERERRARFIMGVTHDLKTPLALIGGYVDAIEDGYAHDPEAMRRYLGIIRQRSAALEEMIGSLIEFARMETREWKGRFERIEAGPFFGELAARFAEDAELLGRRFESSLSLPEGAAFMADPLLSRRAFENIIGNSLRYTDEGGLVRIEAEARAGHIAAKVIDDGPGVPPEERERVFEPFYRGSRSRREEGSGLGLAVVSTVARAQGWAISLEEPEGGRGLVVSVDIPLIA